MVLMVNLLSPTDLYDEIYISNSRLGKPPPLAVRLEEAMPSRRAVLKCLQRLRGYVNWAGCVVELSWICPALSLAHDLTLGIGLEAARKGSGGLRPVGNERSGVDPATFLRLYSGAERPLRGAFIKPPAMRVVVDLLTST